MKAKELYNRYLDFLNKKEACYLDQPEDAPIDELDAAIAICHILLREFGTLSKFRNCKTNSAANSVFKELNQKWIAFCRIVASPKVDTNLFKDYVKQTNINLYNLINW